MRNISQQQLLHQNKSSALKLLLVGCLLSLASHARALSSDVQQPVKIDANSVTFNKSKGYAIYEGGVSIVQGTLKIKASKIEIFTPNNAIQKIIATGSPVSFEQKMDDGKWAKGKANSLRYLVTEKKLILSGGASLSQDRDTFSSAYIQYSTKTGELKAGSSKKANEKATGRVRAIFYPAK